MEHKEDKITGLMNGLYWMVDKENAIPNITFQCTLCKQQCEAYKKLWQLL